MILFWLDLLEFFYGRSYCAPLARAERNGFGCHFLARPKKWPRRAPRRSLLELPWCARKRRGAARPLCSCLRGTLKIQRLRLPLKAQRQTDRAKIFCYIVGEAISLPYASRLAFTAGDFHFDRVEMHRPYGICANKGAW